MRRPGESEEERADRNYGDLLQELRVTETGVAILFSLLLTVPFSQRFPEITEVQRRTFLVALLLAAAANVVLIAPVAHHRLLFAQGQKARVVRWAGRTALLGLVLLVLAVAAVLLLVLDALLDTTASAVLAGLFTAATVGLWFGPPLLISRQAGRGRAGGGS